MNWSMAADVLPIVNTPAYALIRREAATGHGDLGDTVDMRSAIHGLDEDAARTVIADYLAREVAAIFRMPVEDISLKRSLADIGMDFIDGSRIAHGRPTRPWHRAARRLDLGRHHHQ